MFLFLARLRRLLCQLANQCISIGFIFIRADLARLVDEQFGLLPVIAFCLLVGRRYVHVMSLGDG